MMNFGTMFGPWGNFSPGQWNGNTGVVGPMLGQKDPRGDMTPYTDPRIGNPAAGGFRGPQVEPGGFTGGADVYGGGGIQPAVQPPMRNPDGSIVQGPMIGQPSGSAGGGYIGAGLTPQDIAGRLAAMRGGLFGQPGGPGGGVFAGALRHMSQMPQFGRIFGLPQGMARNTGFAAGWAPNGMPPSAPPPVMGGSASGMQTWR